MLVLSLLFVALVILLVFCLSKDTGANTKHARRGIEFPSTEQYQQQKHNSAVDSIKIAKAN